MVTSNLKDQIMNQNNYNKTLLNTIQKLGFKRDLHDDQFWFCRSDVKKYKTKLELSYNLITGMLRLKNNDLKSKNFSLICKWENVDINQLQNILSPVLNKYYIQELEN